MRNSIIKVDDIIYIVLINICLGFKFYEFPYFFKYILALVWCFVFSMNGRKLKIDGTFKRYLYPLLLFFALSIPLILLNGYEVSKTSLLSRAVSQFIQKVTVVIFALSGIWKFGKNVLRLLFQSIILNNVIGIIYAISRFGFEEFLRFISNPFSSQWNIWVRGGRISNALELHEVTLTLGFFLLLVVAFKEIQFYKNKNATIIVLIILIILGFKRIQMLALAVVLITNHVILKRKEKRSIQFGINLITIGVLLVSLTYVYLISNEQIAVLAARYNINFMTRLGWYLSISRFFKFSPLYIGQGWGSLSVLITNIGVVGVHSDILRMYVDAGFMGFIAWIYYYFNYLASYFNKKDPYTCKLYLVIMVYTVVTYLTDNTLNYFVFQVVLLSIPAVSLIDDATGHFAGGNIDAIKTDVN